MTGWEEWVGGTGVEGEGGSLSCMLEGKSSSSYYDKQAVWQTSLKGISNSM